MVMEYISLPNIDPSFEDRAADMKAKGFPVVWCPVENFMLCLSPHWGWVDGEGYFWHYFAENGDELPLGTVDADILDLDERKQKRKDDHAKFRAELFGE